MVTYSDKIGQKQNIPFQNDRMQISNQTVDVMSQTSTVVNKAWFSCYRHRRRPLCRILCESFCPGMITDNKSSYFWHNIFQMRHVEFVIYKYFCRLSLGRSFKSIILYGISDQEGYGEIFSRAARSQSSEYFNFWRLVSRQIDSSLCEMTFNQYISS